MNIKASNKTKSILLTLTILGILILGSTGAEAISIHLTQPLVSEQNATMTGEIDLNANDRVPLDAIALIISTTPNLDNLNDSNTHYCVIGLDGTKEPSAQLEPLTPECSMFNIQTLASKNPSTRTQGYSYGYGYAAPAGGGAIRYQNVSYGYTYGFGYSYGYTYGSIKGSEFQYDITFTAPEKTTNQTYYITPLAMAGTGTQAGTYIYVLDSVFKEFTISGVPAETQAPSGSTTPTRSYPFLQGTESGNTMSQLRNMLGSDITSYNSLGKTITTETINIAKEQVTETLQGFGQEVVDAVNQRIQNRNTIQLDVTTTVEVLKVMRSDGTVENYTRIERTFNNLDNVTVIEVVPKSVAANSSQITGNFSIVHDDPVLEFTLGAGETLSYLVQGDGDTSGVKTITTESGTTTGEEEPTIGGEDTTTGEEPTIGEEEPTTGEEPNPAPGNETTTEPTQPEGTGRGLIIGVIVSLVVLGAALLILRKKGII